MRRRLNRPQALLLILFWAALCYLVLVSATHIDGPLILTLLISGALVFIPIYKREAHSVMGYASLVFE